jgi:tripartite-type tricarboxylate transporter receptor subunit TctC
VSPLADISYLLAPIIRGICRLARRAHGIAELTAATPAVQERLTDLGYALVTPDRRSSEYLQKFVESEIEKWAGVIKTAGVAAQ